jgi:hypothetical protein
VLKPFPTIVTLVAYGPLSTLKEEIKSVGSGGGLGLFFFEQLKKVEAAIKIRTKTN